MDHVLCNGELASKVWNYFADVLGVRLTHLNLWQGIMNFWWLRVSASTQVALCRGILPIVITWALWKNQCVAIEWRI